jgi:hypothetical protein
VAALDDDDPPAAPGEQARGDQAVVAAADHDHIPASAHAILYRTASGVVTVIAGPRRGYSAPSMRAK